MSSEALGEFRVGDVLATSITTMARNVIPFTVLGALVYAPLYVTMFIFAGTANSEEWFQATGFGWMMAVVLLSIFVSMYVVYGAVTYGTVRYLQGKPASFGEIIGRGLMSVLPVVGVALLMSLAIMLGMLLLFIPGIMVMVALWVAIPVAVIERPGVGMSLSRSADLTRGFRWPILGIIIVAGIMTGIFSFAYQLATMMLAPGSIGSLVVVLIGNGLVGAFGAVVAAVGYQRLRAAKEGVDVDELAAVFA